MTKIVAVEGALLKKLASGLHFIGLIRLANLTKIVVSLVIVGANPSRSSGVFVIVLSS